jgi:nitroreductase
MNTLDTIASRRSIRQFTNKPISEADLQKILTAACQAPSGKNRQPWRFVIVKEDQRPEVIRILREGIAKMKREGDDLGSSEWSTVVMEQAPISVFVFNPDGLYPWLAHSIEQNFTELVDTQSIGAAIQNMLLAATELGLGSLLICDVFCAYEEICKWLGEKGQLIAAVSFGYPDEHPPARPRKPIAEVVRVK